MQRKVLERFARMDGAETRLRGTSVLESHTVITNMAVILARRKHNRQVGSMRVVDDRIGARAFQAMVAMGDGTRLNTFVFLPGTGAPRWPVILHRTPYGITAADATDKIDCTRAWLPNPEEPLRGSILRGWRNIVVHGYAAVYQDTRGRQGSEGEDRVYADDAADGHDTLDWIAGQPWSNQMVGMSGSSAGATTTFAAASTRHPTLRAFFAQAGASSIYDDVVCEGQSIEMERLWLWVARNIPGLSLSHRDAVTQRFGVSAAELHVAASSAAARYARLEAARKTDPLYIDSPDWMRLPLSGYPDFSTWQPFLDQIITHPAPDALRAAHNFRRTIEIPGFHVTSWFDIFQTSVIAAFNEFSHASAIRSCGSARTSTISSITTISGRAILISSWCDYWLKSEPTGIMVSQRYSIRRAPGSKTAKPISRVIGAMPSAGRPGGQGRDGSISAVIAVSQPVGLADQRVTTVMIRAGNPNLGRA
jgi:putative CocE/NonD family hydrolase